MVIKTWITLLKNTESDKENEGKNAGRNYLFEAQIRRNSDKTGRQGDSSRTIRCIQKRTESYFGRKTKLFPENLRKF